MSKQPKKVFAENFMILIFFMVMFFPDRKKKAVAKANSVMNVF